MGICFASRDKQAHQSPAGTEAVIHTANEDSPCFVAGRTVLIGLWLVLTFILTNPGNTAFAGGVEEYSVKSAFVYNFAQYTRWPKPADGLNSSGTCDLCVMGSDEIVSAFETINGKAVGSRRMQVRNMTDSMNFNRCHIVFISREIDRAHQLRILAAIQDEPILTVGEINNFARIGGVINLINRSGKLQFEISLDSARQQNLGLSSRLLKLATMVEQQ